MTPASPPVIDTAYLDRLTRHLGRRTVDELLADGLMELGDRRGRLARALDTLPDPAAVAECAQIAHDLKAAAGHLGLAALSAMAAEAQEVARDAKDGVPGTPALDGPVGALLARTDEGLSALSAWTRPEGGAHETTEEDSRRMRQ